jgi:hypothetical protein
MLDHLGAATGVQSLGIRIRFAEEGVTPERFLVSHDENEQRLVDLCTFWFGADETAELQFLDLTDL